MKVLTQICLCILLGTSGARAASMAIDSLSGPVTQNEIASFITYMQAQTPPQTPWGALTGTTGDHNEWADGTGGREMEAMGEMYEISSNLMILNQMIAWADDCVSQRNDLMSAANGGQRVMWTGLIDKVWCPNEPTSADAGYAGCENEDTEGHLAFCAKLILENPSLWNLTVQDGNPYGYGATYFQRATNYLGRCDEANDEYSLKWFIQAGSSLIVAPTNAAWVAENENVNAINRQMMFMSGFQRLAEAHELLGDNPGRVAQYDAIVHTNVSVCLNGMVNFDPYTKNGQPVYDWGYYPTTHAPEATEIHAEYDIIGVWRAFNRSTYGFTLSPLVPFANTMVNVIYLGTNTFAGDVDGGSGIQSPVFSGWILPADWNPAVYTTVAGAAYTNGWNASSADIDAGILFMKNRRYLQFSVTPAPGAQVAQAGTGTTFTVSVAPLGGFTNAVQLSVSGLPAGASGGFSTPTIALASLNYASTNVTLSITTSNTTPDGAYTLTITGASGSQTNTASSTLIVGNFGLTALPSVQTATVGASNVNYTVTVLTNAAFSGAVTLGISGLPAGASASFNPSSLGEAGNSSLSVNAGAATPGNYPLTILGTNGGVVASNSVSLTLTSLPYVLWNGGSAGDNNWSDAGNWGGYGIAANDTLIFDGTSRLSNINDTTAGTAYSNILFNAGAGAFTLAGNPITLIGGVTNNSPNPQTIDLGLNFGGNLTFNGAGGTLIIGGGVTNTLGASGSTTLTLSGAGILTNLLHSAASPGGTNVIALNHGADSWTLMDNPASAATTVPWAISVNAGTFNFGAASSAPKLTSTTPDNSPQDNEVGTLSGAAGTFNMVNGTLTTASRFDTAIATGSTGVVNQVGGTFNMGVQFQGANGQNPGEVSIVNVSGGTMNISGGAGPFYVASRDTGTLNISNGALDCGTLDVSRNAYGNTIGSVGVVNLNGGTIFCGKVATATANSETNRMHGSSAVFNFNGGTLKINSGATPFFQGSTAPPIIPISAIVKSGGAIFDSNGWTNIFAEPLLHDSSLGSAPDGGLTKNGLGCLILISNLTYTGGTTVNAGALALSNFVALIFSPNITVAAGATLDASGRGDATLSLISGQNLTGNGTVKGNVVAGSGATLAPGNSIGVLTFGNNLTLSGGSLTTMEVNKTLLTNDVLQVSGTLTYGGTLALTNLSGTLTNGDSFKLFNAAATSGAFTNLVPSVPGPGLIWYTNSLASGTLAVVLSDYSVAAAPATQSTQAGGTVNYTVTITPTNSFSGTVTLSVSGLPAGGGYSLNPTNITGSGTSTLTVTTSNGIAAGNYPLIITGMSGGLTHSAEVTLQIAGKPMPRITTVTSSGTNLILSGTNGARGGTYYVLTATNVTWPRTNWSMIATDSFDADGNFNFTNALDPASGGQFFLLQVP